jgi:uncharacterized iron-regulated protein
MGCSHRTRPDSPPAASHPEPGIYHVESGERLTESELAGRLGEAPFIVFGEQHTSGWQHERQASLFRKLARQSNGSLALGMEMFQRPFQSALDGFVAGEIDEREMLERTEWSSRWGIDPALYRPLWKTARSQKLPVVALNLPREISKKIARIGLDGLGADEREQVPERVDTSIPAQREYVRRAFEEHGMSEHMEFENFLEAQAAWDETMAETAVEFLRSNGTVDRMFIVAGRAHARSDFGIPNRLERRRGREGSGDVVSVLPHRPSEIRLEQIRSRGIADYIWLERPDQ